MKALFIRLARLNGMTLKHKANISPLKIYAEVGMEYKAFKTGIKAHFRHYHKVIGQVIKLWCDAGIRFYRSIISRSREYDMA